MDTHTDDARNPAHNHRVTGRDFDKRLGQRVRDARIERGMTQEQLGDACDVTYQQIQRYEAGANRIACETLIRIARFLKKPAGDFFAGLTDPAAEIADDPHRRVERGRLLMAWRDMAHKPNNRRLLLQFAELLAGNGEAEHGTNRPVPGGMYDDNPVFP